MKKLLFLCLMAFIANIGFAQVGINTENPNRFTELDIQNIVAGDTIPKGIMIPRMTTAKRNLIDVGSDSTLANGLMIYNTDEDCFNYFSKIESEWQSLCGKLGKAIITIPQCSLVVASGQYLNGKALGTSHFLTIPIHVDKPGTYTISAMPDPTNGYFFSTSGEFLTIGDFTVIVQGAGTPAEFQTDDVIISINGVQSECSIPITVEDSSVKPAFSMNCNSMQVNGTYKLNTALLPTNTISLTLSVNAAADGARYIIQTNEVDGISFSGSGTLIGGSTNQPIILAGSGTPTSITSKVMTLSSNSTTTVSTCSATVPMTISAKRVLTIGIDPNGFGYNFSGTAYSNKLLTTATNFGTLSNSVVKCEPYVIIDGGIDPTLATIQNYLTGSNPVDIVVLGYSNVTLQQTAISQAFATYLNNGGVVLAYQDYPPASQSLLRAVFNNNAITTLAIGFPGSVWRLPSSVNHPILNGPFGDIRGLQWGEDASNTTGAANLPLEDITVLSTDTDISSAISSTGRVTAFVHNRVNFLWIGDGGFNSATSMNPTSSTICPFNLNSVFYPIPKNNYGRGTSFSVYNSLLTANAFAWAIKLREF